MKQIRSARSAERVATESYSPNVPVAARRLRQLGVNVLRIGEAPANNAQRFPVSRGQLPFRSGSFRLVVNRHASLCRHRDVADSDP